MVVAVVRLWFKPSAHGFAKLENTGVKIALLNGFA
jgi:hypothetical protein